MSKLDSNDHKLRDEELTTLVQTMGAAAGSRIPLEVTLAALGEEREDRRLAVVAQRLSKELAQGVPIEQALSKLDRHLPQEVRGLLRAGIESGDLAGTFERFADQRLASKRLARRIQAAIAYPLLVMAILIPLALFASLHIIPEIAAIYEEFDLELPVMTEWVLQTAEQVPEMIAGMVIFAIGLPLLWRIVGGRWLFHRVRSAIPVFGRLWMWSAQRDFASILASFIDLRLPLAEAVGYTGDVLLDRNMGSACRRARGRLDAGQTLSASLAQSIHFEQSLVALVAWGERYGLLTEALGIASEVFEERIDQRAKFIQRLLPPLMLIVVGTVMFFTIIGLVVPLVGLLAGLSM